MATPIQKVAEVKGRAIDGRILRAEQEIAALTGAAARIAELQAELAQLLVEKALIDPQRPVVPVQAAPIALLSRAPDVVS